MGEEGGQATQEPHSAEPRANWRRNPDRARLEDCGASASLGSIARVMLASPLTKKQMGSSGSWLPSEAVPTTTLL